MNTINEEKLAHSLKQHLNAGTRQLDTRISERLLNARRLAVAHHGAKHGYVSQTNSAFTLVAVSQWARIALMIASLSIGIAATYYWNLSSEARENSEIDSALLADDVPPNAYIDPGFRKWLERASPSSAL
jgi:hypothetical protein